ncbi:unnamed protein product, partial [Mesorhabditis belari]|uniref:Transmembrane protein 231 n=1 Tax=Mesorhabditis belari TaxID=2138241 RepID=A0AAF3FCZ2_9BILA
MSLERVSRVYNCCSLTFAFISLTASLIGGLVVSVRWLSDQDGPLFREMRAASCSFSSLIVTLLRILKIGLPFLFLIFTRGVWQKTSIAWETPFVSFFGDYMLIVKSENDYRFASSFPQLNTIDSSHLVFSNLETSALDSDQDGKNDLLTLNFHLPLEENFTVVHLDWIVFLDYRLMKSMDLEADVALVGSTSVPDPKASFEMSGVLGSNQLAPIPETFKQRLFPSKSDLRAIELSYSTLIGKIRGQMLGVDILRSSSSWLPSSDLSFRLSFTIPSQTLIRATTTWELLKWAWIQYLALLLASDYLFTRLLDSFYENGVIDGFTQYNIDEMKK